MYDCSSTAVAGLYSAMCNCSLTAIAGWYCGMCDCSSTAFAGGTVLRAINEVISENILLKEKSSK